MMGCFKINQNKTHFLDYINNQWIYDCTKKICKYTSVVKNTKYSMRIYNLFAINIG